MNILIIKGSDRHTYRIIDGFKSCNVFPKVISSINDVTNDFFDLVLIDPSFEWDISNKIKYDRLGFFDTEDGVLDFNPGIAYETLKHKAHFYAKMNYVENDRNDNIKNVGFPLSLFTQLAQVAKLDVCNFEHSHAIPFFVGHSTFIGNYKGAAAPEKYEDVTSIGVVDNNGIPELVYNQRIQWLNSLKKNNIPFAGGIVFPRDSHSIGLDWQKNIFGKVEKLECSPVSRDTYLNLLMNKFKLGLCPTGHERNSWRVFDIMSCGSILIWNDNKNQKSMYTPKQFITIKDEEDLGTRLLSIQKDYKEIWKAHQENKKLMASLTPEKILNDFIESIK
jgi:hypothetical protein